MFPSDLPRKMVPAPRRAAVQVYDFGDESVLHDEARGDLTLLNKTAAAVWRCCDGTVPLSEIAADLMRHYDVDAALAEDHVEQLVSRFARCGLLAEIAESTTSTPRCFRVSGEHLMVGIREPQFGRSKALEAEIGDIRVRLRSDALHVSRDFAELYPPPPASSHTSADPICMEVRAAGRSRLGRRLYTVYGDGQEIAGPRAASELFPFLEWGINLRVIARYSQYLQLHAASLACNGTGVVFAGGSGCGKSTLAAGLMARGWNYLCDEFALIDPGTLALRPFPKALCIKAGSFPTVAASGLRFSSAQHYVKGLKGRVAYIKPTRAALDPTATPAPVRYVVFPKHEDDAPPRLCRLSRGRAFLELAGCVFNKNHFTQDGLPVLAEVIRQAECFRLEGGSLRQTCELLEKELGLSAVPLADRAPRFITGKPSLPIPPSCTTFPATASDQVRLAAPSLPTRRDALRLGTRLAYNVPTVMTFSAHKAFAQASNPSGVCSTGVQTGGLCSTDSDCCSGQCDLGVCD